MDEQTARPSRAFGDRAYDRAKARQEALRVAAMVARVNDDLLPVKKEV